jgi:hypothetical protein
MDGRRAGKTGVSLIFCGPSLGAAQCTMHPILALSTRFTAASIADRVFLLYMSSPSRKDYSATIRYRCSFGILRRAASGRKSVPLHERLTVDLMSWISCISKIQYCRHSLRDDMVSIECQPFLSLGVSQLLLL